MRCTVRSLAALFLAGALILLTADRAAAQPMQTGSEQIVIVIDGVEYELDGTTGLPPGFDQLTLPDESSPLPPSFVVLDSGQPIPPALLNSVPPEYAFFIDPSKPVPEEFQFLVDPRLPIPAEYEFMFDERLPVPDEWTWLFGPNPTTAVSQQVDEPVQELQEQAPTDQEPQPEPETKPVQTEDDPQADEPDLATATQTSVAVDLSALADDETETEAADEKLGEREDPNTTAAAASQPAQPQTQPSQGPMDDLMVPLLIFVAVASTALLAAIPIFLRGRSDTDSALRELVLTDDLTKLANRRRLDRDLQAHQRKKTSIAVAMIDIDHFKRLNDDYSHAVGDVVLQHVAATISKHVRSNDVAYRYGGEEFCVLLPGATENEAAAVVDRVRRAIEALSFDFLDRTVTISAGVAVAAPGDIQGSHATVRQADAALYAAKGSGRNRVMLGSLVGTKPA